MREMTYELLTWSAVISGLMAAWLWYRASTIIIRAGDPRAKGGVFINGVDVSTTAYEQGRGNKFAAIATAVTVALQTLAPFFAAACACTPASS